MIKEIIKYIYILHYSFFIIHYLPTKKTPTLLGGRFGLCRHYLFSRAASSQVSSAQMSLTTVFGMGTGGPSSQSTPTHETVHLVNARDILTEQNTNCKHFFAKMRSLLKINKKTCLLCVCSVKLNKKSLIFF